MLETKGNPEKIIQNPPMAAVPLHEMRYLYTIKFLLNFRPIDSFRIMIYMQYVGKRGRTFIVLKLCLYLDEYANQNNIINVLL